MNWAIVHLTGLVVIYMVDIYLKNMFFSKLREWKAVLQHSGGKSGIWRGGGVTAFHYQSAFYEEL